MENNKHLLDILCEKVGCNYLSDLKLEKTRPAALREIRSRPKEDYPIKMWNETLSYIYGKSIIISSPKDVDTVINLRELRI